MRSHRSPACQYMSTWLVPLGHETAGRDKETERVDRRQAVAGQGSAMMRSRFWVPVPSDGRSRPPFGMPARVTIARSMSAAVATRLDTSSIREQGNRRRGRPQEVVIVGRLGCTCQSSDALESRRDLPLSIASHLPKRCWARTSARPVRLPPGRARLRDEARADRVGDGPTRSESSTALALQCRGYRRRVGRTHRVARRQALSRVPETDLLSRPQGERRCEHCGRPTCIRACRALPESPEPRLHFRIDFGQSG